jgi:hypothetical protein
MTLSANLKEMEQGSFDANLVTVLSRGLRSFSAFLRNLGAEGKDRLPVCPGGEDVG